MKQDDFGKPLSFNPLAYIILIASVMALCYCLYELFGK